MSRGALAGGDRGSATVEFALVLPALVLVVAAGVGSLGVAAQAIRLADVAAVAARAEGRDDHASAAAAVGSLPAGARMDVSGGDPVCVRLSARAPLGPVADVVPLEARSCAPAMGR